MEVPLPGYMDEIRTTTTTTACCGFGVSFSESSLFKRRRSLVSPTRTKMTSTSRAAKCSSATGQSRKPRPETKRFSVEDLAGERRVTAVARSSGGICDQIEKLVLHKRYEDALELLEIAEIAGFYGVGARTFDALVSACIGLNSIRAVKKVFDFISRSGFELDLYLRNRVLCMHVRCGMMLDARKLFDEMPERNLVSWTTIIAGVVDSGDFVEAFRLFSTMWEEFSDVGPHTFATVVRACSGLGLVSVGRQVHSCAMKMGTDKNVFVACALINMYSKCGCIEDAQLVFDGLPEKTTVGWNSMIAGYALDGRSEEALSLYYEMRDSGVKMDDFTFSMIIKICTRLASLEHAKQVHADLVSHGYELDVVVNTALVDFYGKWGRVEDARSVFDKMPYKNVMTWNALIAGYGNHGRGGEAVEMFEKMLRDKITPNHVTFLAVLSACSYSGLLECGWEIFESMSRDHNIKPRAMHYTCMIELLGKEGLLDEAYAMIRNAPFEPKINMWVALLTACRVHGDLKLGKLAAEKIYGMEPEKLGNYLVLLNIYNTSGKLKEAAGVVRSLKRKGLRILPACSWIEMKKRPHVFHSGDKTHVETDKIYRKVDELMAEISEHGYVPDRNSLLPDVDEREERKSYHSEKLAIAFGLISTSDGKPLQIVQGHRVCGDCHSAIKLMALVSGREIVLRDGSRFHHFKDGNCSCRDYW